MREARHVDQALVPARLVRGTRGAVASPHYLASEAGLHILRAGGSAVDAAIATNAALSVVMAYACGLGGDAFWLIWDGERVHGLNGSGRSARAATLQAAAEAGLAEMPLRGPWTVTVPGAIHSWGEAHRRFGRAAWPTLLEPAVELAEGFAATPGWSAAVERSLAIFGADGDWARTFRTHGRAWRPGEVVRLPALAASLRRLAEEGPDAAYTGSLARQAAEYLAQAGSPLRANDFATHRSDWTEPLSLAYRGHLALSHGPNSCGPLALLMLGLLERFNPPPAHSFGPNGVADAAWVHIGLEAARLALAARDALLTDPDAMDDGALDELLSEGRLDELAARISLQRATVLSRSDMPAAGGTVFLAAADREGQLVSLVESNAIGFGSGLVDTGTGIAYQNRGAWFRLDPAQANVLAPAKRAVHTLTPGMLLRDGRAWIAHGQMGGEIQPQIFSQFVSAVVDAGLDIATAVAAARWAAEPPAPLQPASLATLESRYASEVAEGLRDRGHDVSWADAFASQLGHAHAVELQQVAGDLSLAAAADPRSEGAALAW